MRLRAALENLADNAVKFTERGRVALSVERRAGAAQAPSGSPSIVTDSGIGLSAQEIARLFRPFAQANAAVARRYGGAGLGLVFVRASCQGDGRRAHGRRAGRAGQHVPPHRDGRAAQPASRRAARRRRATLPTRSLRVLCAEDNPYARVVLNTVLAELGHRVDFAGTGEAAVAAVERGGYDLVLMDVTLPGMDGACGDARDPCARRRGRRVPIIGISGRTEAARRDGMPRSRPA